MPMLAKRLIELFVMKLITAFVERAFERRSRLPPTTDDELDRRLHAFKEAYKDAFDGTPITEEQRKKLNASIESFIRLDDVGVQLTTDQSRVDK
jgi:hypothetical protein